MTLDFDRHVDATLGCSRLPGLAAHRIVLNLIAFWLSRLSDSYCIADGSNHIGTLNVSEPIARHAGQVY